jgi:hypothetical protein
MHDMPEKNLMRYTGQRLQSAGKIIIPVILLLIFSIPAFAQEKNTFSLGGLVEANANTRHGYGLAGGLTMDYGITDSMAVGLKADYGSDFYDVTSAEIQAFFRYYFLNFLPYPLFVQAGGGGIMLQEPSKDKTVFSVLADGSLGIRFPIKKFYTEQYIRFGWPHGFGFGLAIGYRFGTTVKKEAPALVEETKYIPPDTRHLDGLMVSFPPNVAVFESTDAEWRSALEENIFTMNSFAFFLRQYPEYFVIATGHANPIIGTEEENLESLIPLSRERAEYVKEQLIRLGVEGDRIIVEAVGALNADPADGAGNRRVDFRLERLNP